MSKELRSWAIVELRGLLGFEDVETIADQMIYGIGTARDGSRAKLIEYARDVLGDGCGVFIDELSGRLFPADDAIASRYASSANLSKKARRKAAGGQASIQAPDPNRGRGLVIKTVPASDKSSARRPKRDRQSCACFGLSHNSFANCLSCGRILCVLEGEGPCFFCGSYVLKDHTDVAARDAIQRKDTILQYQQEMTQRARVIDEQDANGYMEATLDGPQAMTIDIDTSRAFANNSLQGNALKLYEMIHASLGAK